MRFERVEGRPVDLAAMPAFRLEDRRVEVLLPGAADTWVTVPALNEAAGIRATLRALEAQTLRPLVVCVVDNGSTDGTTDVVRAWAADAALRAAEGVVLESQGRLMAEAGYGWADVVRVETTVVDALTDAEIAAVGRVTAEFLGGLTIRPAAGTLRVVSRLIRPGILVELELIAAR